MYRVPSSVVRKGKGFSVIQDNGVLRRTTTDSTGSFLFNDNKAGAKAMALIGTLPEIKDWCKRHARSQIRNTISELPHIYMGMCPYMPGSRYKGLFPASDFAAATLKKGAGVGGAHMPSGGGLGAIGEDIQELAEKGVESSEGLWRKIFGRPKNPKKDLTLYVKIDYLPEEKMSLIGVNELSIEQLAKIIELTADKMFKKK